MTNDNNSRCRVPGCDAESQPVGPAFCPEHWKAIPRITRKYLNGEFTMGERAGWPDWFTKIYSATVATIADRVSERESKAAVK